VNIKPTQPLKKNLIKQLKNYLFKANWIQHKIN